MAYGWIQVKPFGIAVSGCVDGYSRNIIWLEAFTTINDPRVILHYYMKSVSAREGCPRRIRADFGTENGLVRQAQTFLRRNGTDSMAGTGSEIVEPNVFFRYVLNTLPYKTATLPSDDIFRRGRCKD